MKPSVFNIDDQGTMDNTGTNDLNKKTKVGDEDQDKLNLHKKLFECATEYCKTYPMLEKNMRWVKWLEQMMEALDEECECESPTEEPSKEKEEPGQEKIEPTEPEKDNEEPMDIPRLLKGLKLVHDKPSAVYTDTIQKQAAFEKAKPKLASIMQRLEQFSRWVGGGPTKEEYQAIQQELFAALWYITK